VGQPDYKELRFPTMAAAIGDSGPIMFLLLLEMQENRALKLPFRAAEQTPPSIRQRLSASRPLPMLEHHGERPDEE
jgi:hypothetical protein